MAKLDPADRAKLPDNAFAYVDSRGQRRLPIHDEAHVRNALARFGRVRFEDERARERARKRLLNAAKRYGIVPVGFIAGQLQSEREYGQRKASEAVQLPSGFVTMLLTDIENSTALLHRLADGYGTLLDGVRGVLRATAADVGGVEVETRADECFIVFERPGPALEMAAKAPARAARAVMAEQCPGAGEDRDPQRPSDAGAAELHRHGRQHRGADLRRGPRRTDPRLGRDQGGGPRRDPRRRAVQEPRRVPPPRSAGSGSTCTR